LQYPACNAHWPDISGPEIAVYSGLPVISRVFYSLAKHAKGWETIACIRLDVIADTFPDMLTAIIFFALLACFARFCFQ
jgi:hypothetical protein